MVKQIFEISDEAAKQIKIPKSCTQAYSGNHSNLWKKSDTKEVHDLVADGKIVP